MSLDETIYRQVQKLPPSQQEELLSFLRHLLAGTEHKEVREWTAFALSSAMRGMEDEESLYTLSDLKVVFE